MKYVLRSAGLFMMMATILLAGCSPQPGGQKTQPVQNVVKPGDYFPLQTGNQWQYQGEGNEFASFKREILFNKDIYAQAKEDNGGVVITSVYETTDNLVRRTFYKPEETGTVNLLENKLVNNDNTVILQGPIQVGTTWDNKDSTSRIVDLDTTVATPYGTFTKCLKVQSKSKNSSSTTDEYYQKGVGMVRRDFVSDQTHIVSALQAYTIK